MQRFLPSYRKVSAAAERGFWLSSLFAIVALVILLLVPSAQAAPIVVDDSYDFQTGPQGWTATPVGRNGFTPPVTGGKQWTHTGNQWSVNWSPVNFPPDIFATGNYLTSPLIDAGAQVGGIAIDSFRISVAHKFNFPTSTNAVPSAAGQWAYSINNGPFVGISGTNFQSGLVTTPDPLFGASPLVGPPSLVGQTALVTPAYVPPSGGYPDLFPLINGGASFTGVTAGYTDTGGIWVPSVAVVTFEPTLVDTFQVRFINANLGSNCPLDAGWDIRFAQVDFAAPEPSSFMLAGVGAAVVAAGYIRRRRLRRLWNTSARAGCDGRGPGKPSAFPAVDQVEKGRA
jgi:hypothetical protein